MKKMLWILLLVSIHGYGQQYTRGQIKYYADSILKSFVGQDMFDHCKCKLSTDAYIYYRYTDRKGCIRSAEVPRHNKLTRGDFGGVDVWYRMEYPYPKCPVCDVTRGEMCVSLNRYLDMAKSPDIGFIPDYIWEKDSCRFRQPAGL